MLILSLAVFAPLSAWSLPLFALTGFALGATGPSRDLIVRNATPKGASGRVYGFVYSGLDLGSSLAPIWFGAMLDHGSAAHVPVAIAVFLSGGDRHGRAGSPRRARRRWRDGGRGLSFWFRRAMDLGMAGRKALVCAASKGLGRGCAEALAREGVRRDDRGAHRSRAFGKTADDIGAIGRPRGALGRLRHHDRRRAARRRSPRARSPTSWSTTPAARRPATSATGTATHGSARSTPTC